MRSTTVLVGIGIVFITTGCYTPSQPKLEQHVRSWIRIGMPFAQAISVLGAHGMVCSGGNPARCGRSRGGLLSCVEGVDVGFEGANMLVDTIEVRKIACIGGF